MRRSRVRFESAEENVPWLPARTLTPDDFECGPGGAGVVQGLNEGLGHIGAGNPVPRSQRMTLLTDLNRSLPAGTVQEEARPNDRVIDTAGPDLVLDLLAPAQCVSLDKVEDCSAERRRGNPDGRHVEKATIESCLSGGSERVQDALVLRSEEHTSELQSPCNLVCRLLLE